MAPCQKDVRRARAREKPAGGYEAGALTAEDTSGRERCRALGLMGALLQLRTRFYLMVNHAMAALGWSKGRERIGHCFVGHSGPAEESPAGPLILGVGALSAQMHPEARSPSESPGTPRCTAIAASPRSRLTHQLSHLHQLVSWSTEIVLRAGEGLLLSRACLLGGGRHPGRLGRRPLARRPPAPLQGLRAGRPHRPPRAGGNLPSAMGSSREDAVLCRA